VQCKDESERVMSIIIISDAMHQREVRVPAMMRA
jgi:hypothetical protein